MTRARRKELGFWVVAGLVAATAVAAVWVVDYIPTNDGPEHVLHAHLVNQWRDDPEALRDYLERSSNVTNQGFAVLLAPLERLFPWRTALRLGQSVMVLLWGGALLALAWAVDRRRRWLGLAGFATCFNALFYLGFFNYYVAQALGFAVLAIAWRVRHRVRHLALVTGLGLLLVAIAHAFAAIVTGVLLVVLVVPSQAAGQRWRALVAVGLAGLPAAVIALLTAAAPIDVDIAVDQVLPSALLSELGELPGYAFGLPIWGAIPVMGFGVLAPLRALAAHRDERLRGRGHLAVIALVAIGASLLSPLSLPGWQVISPRLLVVGLALGWVTWPAEVVAPGRERLVELGALALAVAALGLAAWRHVDLRAACAPALEALELEVPGADGVRIALFLEDCHGDDYCHGHHDGAPLVNATDHLGALFAVAHGGVPNRFFHGYQAVHPFVLSDQSRIRMTRLADDWQTLSCLISPALERGGESGVPDEETRRRWLESGANDLAQSGAAATSVYVYGRGVHELAGPLQRRGYRLLIDAPPHLLARFEGCPVTVAMPAAWGVEGETRLGYGWFPDHDVYWAWHWVAPDDPAPASVALPNAPCGPIWINAWHESADGSKQGCRGAIDGFLAVPVDGPHTSVTCDAIPLAPAEAPDGAP